MEFFPAYCTLIGIDPARNITMVNPKNCDVFINDYFPPGPDVHIPVDGAKLITSFACFYDVEDLGAFCDGIYQWLHDDGVWIAQMSYLPDTLATRNVGDFCHEHTSFFTLDVLNRLLNAHHLHIIQYTLNAVNGGSVRIAVQKGDGVPFGGPDTVTRTHLMDFKQQVDWIGEDLRAQLLKYRRSGIKVLGLGASTKFNGVVSMLDIGPDLLPAVCDRNPEKWGRTMVTGIPIISEDEARAIAPDVFVLGIPQFLDASRDREAEFVARGGRFLTVFPEVREKRFMQRGLAV